MEWKKILYLITVSILLAVTVTGCEIVSKSTDTSKNATRPKGWTEETHGNNVAPNYAVVFVEDKVNQLKITISPDDWETMQANMTEIFGQRGAGQMGRAPGAGGIVPGDNIPGGAPLPNPGALPGGAAAVDNPMWVAATVEFNGLTWTYVGVRYKGNSSLFSGWRSGIAKLPLKLDFDQFEDEYPAIKNQRFYGFKQLTLSNSFSDGTYMRDVLASDILEKAGLPAAATAYYEIIVNYGQGDVNLGLYVMIEVIDDTTIAHYFGDDSGNIYEADGPASSLRLNTLNRLKESFIKENNQNKADWSDIEALYNVLHADIRLSDPAAWRKSLESKFDVDTFLEWLAISAIIQHWDTYGSMTHNFYLYHDPDTDLLTWISWDHNQVLADGRGGVVTPPGARFPAGGLNRNVTLDKKDIGQNWPLIRFLLDDPVYYRQYVRYIKETINNIFTPDKMKKSVLELAQLIKPFAVKEGKEAAFNTAVQVLLTNINTRYRAARDFLAAEAE